ncbi:aminotransferase class V-fold PLP-dependent enzyme [Caloramator sp. Dgby_cultured_2]|uniref:aminotransferase class V-fold PLP-dependent enzyme n=1 Tax=Caloramator sp. Dgby_cultured_2 TaxID=3029174 RepID=UPI00237DE3E1|nr:aminotransferase class V-fold PLP-dependent enzyme [Caloramator sp. Dgby_cultured_2]WDU83092.1 aminotransferase class V-fold PLP-dependent enzyme [Caloramator sp. Dgby_cultured_2]
MLVNGSTSGIYSMILGLTKPKDKIIIQRNCHRSVYSAAFLGDLEVEYINPSVLKDFNIPVSINLDEAFKVIEKNKDAKAIVVTYPTYYGTCLDLKRLIEYAHRFNILVLVDEAHVPISPLTLNSQRVRWNLVLMFLSIAFTKHCHL